MIFLIILGVTIGTVLGIKKEENIKDPAPIEKTIAENKVDKNE
jgi:hypothetical protein